MQSNTTTGRPPSELTTIRVTRATRTDNVAAGRCRRNLNILFKELEASFDANAIKGFPGARQLSLAPLSGTLQPPPCS